MTGATRISTLLVGLTLMALSISPSASGSRAVPAPALSSAERATAPARLRHRLPEDEGCFVPPPEPVEVAPCDSGRTSR